MHEGKPVYLEFGGNLVPVAKSGEQLSIPFRAFRENRVAFPVMIKTQDLEPMCRCQFMRDPKVPKGEPSPTPVNFNLLYAFYEVFLCYVFVALFLDCGSKHYGTRRFTGGTNFPFTCRYDASTYRGTGINLATAA